MTESTTKPKLEKEKRGDLAALHQAELPWFTRFQIRLVRSTFRPGPLNRVLRFFQRTIGQSWIHYSTRHLRRIVGEEYLPPLGEEGSVLVVANHRSFFDLYVITSELVRRGLRKRIVFPVRANFFYTNPLGFVVNFWMSFLSMYPPIFRERKLAALNLTSLDELGRLLEEGGVFAGLHPEGTRNTGADPYSLLPAQPGVGRVIYSARNTLIVPVFVSGLGNDVVAQIRGNFTRKGERIYVVFGPPVDVSDLLSQKPSPKVYREISERCLAAVRAQGEVEREQRQRDGFPLLPAGASEPASY